jgi:hypothetical protein
MTRPPRPFLRSLLLLPALWAPASLSAQTVLLRLHPHVGDTLRTRLEQLTEVSGTVASHGGSFMKPVSTSVSVISRTIVRQSLPGSTVVLTIVDSADIHTSDAHGATQVADAERALRGQQLMLRLASDGTVESARDARGGTVSPELAQSMSSMPAVLPQQAVSVGDQWMREMPLPAGGPMGAGGGHVIAAFRLDSLGRGGSIAYVSMQGDIRPDASAPGAELSGAVSGAMQIDRVRGWMTDSRFTIVLRSLVTPPLASGFAPMRLVTRVTQRLRTMDRR